MSLPWKKPKSSRISRFMADFQQSPKRCGSLVVETGFPTSLIDLFVKNRDRLKKSSSKRHKRHTQTAPTASSPQQPRLFPPQTSVPPMDPVIVQIPIGKDTLVSGGLTAEKKHKHASENNGYGCGGSVLIAFKFIIVTMLAFSTKKKLTFGITLSTLALLFLELVAARVFTLFKPVSIHNKTVISSKKIETFDDSINSRDEMFKLSCLNPKPEILAAIPIPEKSNSMKKAQQMFTIRDLLLKDEITSKSSKLKSKIVKKLMSYKKKKKTMKIDTTKQQEERSLVSVEKPKREHEEEKSNPPLMESREDKTNGIVVIVIVLVGLFSGKVIAIGTLILSCLVLSYTSLLKHLKI